MKEEKKEIDPARKEILAKISMYETEIDDQKKVGNFFVAEAIRKEVDNLKKELYR
jgi:hypothetical protein